MRRYWFVVRVLDQNRQASHDSVVSLVVAVVFENPGLRIAEHVEVGSYAGDQFPYTRIKITVKLLTRPRKCPLVPNADLGHVVPALLDPRKKDPLPERRHLVHYHRGVPHQPAQGITFSNKNERAAAVRCDQGLISAIR